LRGDCVQEPHSCATGRDSPGLTTSVAPLALTSGAGAQQHGAQPVAAFAVTARVLDRLLEVGDLGFAGALQDVWLDAGRVVGALKMRLEIGACEQFANSLCKSGQLGQELGVRFAQLSKGRQFLADQIVDGGASAVTPPDVERRCAPVLAEFVGGLDGQVNTPRPASNDGLRGTTP
jgi:hypothetical protein